jgi:hypothetical protein
LFYTFVYVNTVDSIDKIDEEEAEEEDNNKEALLAED